MHDVRYISIPNRPMSFMLDKKCCRHQPMDLIESTKGVSLVSYHPVGYNDIYFFNQSTTIFYVLCLYLTGI
jgi:hypothetical protein